MKGASEDEQEFTESLLKYNLVSQMTAEKYKSTYNELEGFKIDSELSRKLLLGVFESSLLQNDDHDELEDYLEEIEEKK